GTWSPAINNTATTTYTFTPTAGQCATTTTLTITINPNITPTFNITTTLLLNSIPPNLPTISFNNISGSWSPSTINTTTIGTTVYTFTPNAGQCALPIAISIDVINIPTACYPNPNVALIQSGTHLLSDLIDDWFITYGSSFVTVAAFPNLSTINGLDFSLIGELVIDIPVSIENSNFYCFDNSQITNITQNYLHFGFCAFSACNNMWRGIDNTGELLFRNCTIEDAFYGVKMNWESINDIHHNTFRNNLFGIYSSLGIGSSNNIQFLNYGNTFTNPNNLKPWHNGNILLNLQRSLAGIYLNNFEYAEIDVPIAGTPTLGTIFDNISCGIYTSNTTLIVNNTFFNNITPFSYQVFNNLTPVYSGSGVYHRSTNQPFDFVISPYQGISQNITFQNCTTGINLRRSNTKIYDVGFQNVRSGILGSNLAFCEVSIGNNLINAFVNGISLNTVDNNDYITISNNRINVFSFDNLSTGIYIGAALNTTTANSYIYLDLNRIEVFNGRAGIFAQNIENPSIIENRVKRNIFGININLPPWINIQNNPNPLWAGIRSENNSSAEIRCNEVLLGQIYGNPVNTGSDITLNQSKFSKLSCNKAYGKAFNGINIVGPCDDSFLENNEIGSHAIGMYLSNNAVIGKQPVNPTYTVGNQWLGSYSNSWANAGAVNLNVSSQAAIVNNQILSNGGIGDYPLYPDNYPDNNPPIANVSWFLSDGAPTLNCNPVCGVIPPIIAPVSGTMSLSEAIALGLVTASQYNNETRWILDKNLLLKLKLHDSLVFVNDTLLQFFNDPTKNNLKKLNRIEDTLKHVKPVKDLYADQIAQQNSLMTLLRENMSEQLLLMQDSLLQDSAYQQYLLLLQNYKQLKNEKQQWLDEIIQRRNELSDEALIENTAFVPENYNEELSKIVNDIYFRTYGRGIDTLKVQDINLLESIIHICPQAGGPAVFRARALYQTVNDTVIYNDSLVCRDINYYREIQEQWEQKAEIKSNKEKFSLYLFPNPVSNQLSIMFSEETSGEIKIIDAMGKLIRLEEIKQQTKQKIIEVRNLPAGLYFIQFSNSKLTSLKKFIKQ
ncbi:MAG: T9SS type A sorting domain-containing protein, partial [Bacteroidia bacterium]|nr:T9SS type A sorting domain-containing protein [Bacteroidia bacterium]